MISNRSMSPAISEGGWSLFSLRPSGVGRAASWSRLACQRASVTITAPASGSGSSSWTNSQGSSTRPVALMSGIELLLEGLEADAPIGIEEALAVRAYVEIGVDDGLHRVHHLGGAERRPDDVADGGVLVGAAAEGDLVELGAVLVDAEDADVADMMVAAGIDAAGDLDLQLADVEQLGQVGEMLADLLRHRDRAGVGERAVVEAGAGDDVAGQADIRRRQLQRLQQLPQLVEIGLGDVRQHQVLLVADAHLAEAVAIGEIGDGVHLRIRGVAGDAARRLQRQRDDRIALPLVRRHVGADPAGETDVAPQRAFILRHRGVERAIGRWREEAADAFDLGHGQVEVAVADLLPLLLDQLGEAIDADAVDEDLDARFIEIVAPAELIVDAEYRLQVGQQVPLRQERPDRLGDHGRAALAAADQHFEADLAGLVSVHAQADVMHLHGGAVLGRSCHGYLELARQERELRMEGRPLPDDLAVDARVLDLVAGHAGEMVGGDVADAVAGGLDGMHLHARQRGQDVRRVLEPDPVELQVLPRREVA